MSAGSFSSGNQKSGVDQLGWISGCWVSDKGNERTEEQWTKPAGQSMLGIGRTVAGGKTVFTEFIQIREINGEIAYTVALGMGARPVSFKLIKSSDKEAVFENPQHDFPQRIIYRRESADSLFARIEGQEKGVNKGMDFRFKRAGCD
jgi:hypothetical protein